MLKKTSRKRRRPAKQEKIYTSNTGTTITTSQIINEILAKYRCKFLGIDDNKPWEHPDIKDFYSAQWGDISGLLRRFDGRLVLEVIQQNDWICNPKYQMSHPLRSKKIIEQIKAKSESHQIYEKSSIIPTNFIKERTKKERLF